MLRPRTVMPLAVACAKAAEPLASAPGRRPHRPDKWLGAMVGLLVAVAVAVLVGQAKAASTGPLPPPASGAAPFPDCPAVAVIGTRGSGEKAGAADWGEGLGPPVDAFAADIRTQIPDAEYTYTPYPAIPVLPASLKTAAPDLLNGLGAKLHKYWLGAYHASLLNGETRLRSMILAQQHTCGTKTDLFLAGYSQGAEVTGDVYAALTPAQRTAIGGVALFGDPLYSRSSAAAVNPHLIHDGILGRRSEFPADARGRVRSYCNPQDPVCQGWTQIIHWTSAHKTYPQTASLDAAMTLAPYPRPANSAAACGSGPPMIDITFDFVGGVLTHDMVVSGTASYVWGHETGRARWQIWETSPGEFCQFITGTGTFTTVAGPSPTGHGQLSGSVRGTMRDAWVDRFPGTLLDHPTKPMIGYVGKTYWVCSGGCPPGAPSFNPLFFFFSNGGVVSTSAGEARMSVPGEPGYWWSTTTRLGDITG